MKIFYLINDLNIGGASLGAVEEIKLLKANNNDFIVFSSGGLLEKELNQIGVSHHNIGTVYLGSASESYLSIKEKLVDLLRIFNRGRIFFSVLKILLFVKKEKPSLLYACQPYSALVAYLVHIIAGIPYIVRVQGRLTNEAPHFFFKKKIIKHCSSFSTINKEISEQLEVKHNIPYNKINIIPSVINFTALNRTKEIDYKYLKKDLNIQEESKVIVSLTSHREDKINPVLSLIECIKIIGNTDNSIVLILIGDGSEQELINEHAEKVNKYLSRKAIVIVGKQLNIYPILKIANLGVGVGRCAIEILAAETILLCASQTSIGGLFNEGNASILAKYNFTGRNRNTEVNSNNLLKELICFFQLTENEKKKLKTFGKNFILSNYSPEVIKYNTQKLFKEI